MQITLLPPLLPTDGVTSVPTASAAFTPGARIVATVLSTGLEGGTLLSLAGRQMPTGATLPYPPGTTLRLEVVQGGEQPLLRLVSAETAVGAGASPAGDPQPPPIAPGPPVSVLTYGLAAAVLAAREGGDVRAAALAAARWVPALVTRGLVSDADGEAMLKALGPVPVRAEVAGTPEASRSVETMARAIADRVANGGLLLERRLADVVRADLTAVGAVASDLRSRLALALQLLQDARPGLEGAHDALAGLQEALLAEQARVAAHLAREGVVDVRVPLQVEGAAAEMRLGMRVEREADDRTGEEDPSPWRQVRLYLALEGLGRVQVRLGVVDSQVRVEFLVEHPESADRIEAGLLDLDSALEGAGFAQVLSRVVVDPVTVCAPDDLPDLPAPHTILDARA